MIDKLWQVLVLGTFLGGYYSLLALGLTLLYGVARIVNLAHGTLFMLGAFICYAFSAWMGLNPWFAFAMTIVFEGILGAILYRTVIHPILGDDVAILVVTITLAVLIQNLVNAIFGFNTLIPSLVYWKFYHFPGVDVSNFLIIAFVASIVLFGIVVFLLNKLKVGRAMRALSQDREAAMLMGINTTRLFMLVMILSAVLAAVAGFLGNQGQTITYGIWVDPLTTAFAIVVLGGLGSMKGSLLGSFIIAYSQQAVMKLAPQGGSIVQIVPLTAMITILIIRPKGLFGKRIEMEE